ncbi:hypothetical protein BCAR13_390005 [Paraburkholderia caribensis]|nr:hypothetical protein BCAR13_390005 [Paraburkholderia caribensis]
MKRKRKLEKGARYGYIDNTGLRCSGQIILFLRPDYMVWLNDMN